jgi:hypothetical protein
MFRQLLTQTARRRCPIVIAAARAVAALTQQLRAPEAHARGAPPQWSRNSCES